MFEALAPYLIIISVIARPIEQIAVFRPTWTWLPEWAISTGDRLNRDGYHITSALHYWSMYYSTPPDNPLLFPLVWLAYGLLHDGLYHWALIKPEHRDLKKSFFVQLFCRGKS